MLIQILCILLLLPAFLVCAYYWFLALYSLFTKQKKDLIEQESIHTFAIVIPAHNEESVIFETLQSCAELDYPKDKYKVFVVADNCSDRTVDIAMENGATCLKRHEEVNKGKGFALEWAFERILPEKHDAMIVLDADCQLDSHALDVFDQYLANGDKVLQANDVASNPDVSTMSYAVAVGNLIENDLFYAPKSKLGMAVFLRGTGVVLHREVLKTHPWKAHSIVEDVEYTLSLIREGIRVRFVGEVKVRSEFPAHQDQLNIQRTRWASGNLSIGKKNALKLIKEGLLQKQRILIDAGWTFLVLSRPLVLLELFITVMLAAICSWLVPAPLSNALLGIAIVLALFQGLYFVLGVLLLGVNARRIALLLSTPAVVVRLIAISLLGFFGVDKNIWARTPR